MLALSFALFDSVKHAPTRPTLGSNSAASRISISWLSATAALALLILTATYASGSDFITKYRLIGRSPSNVLLIIRVLSELSGLMLIACINASLEKVQWMLVTREQGGDDVSEDNEKDDRSQKGVCFLDYLSLHQGTGVLGLLKILFFRVPILSARAWSAIRILSLLIVPLLNVVIMADVGTTTTFDKLGTPMYGYGMGVFNASLAQIWQPMTDLLYSSRFEGFLFDSTASYDLTSPAARSTCDVEDPDIRRCVLRYYITAGIENFAPEFLSVNHNHADAFLAENQNGYVLEYQDGSDDWQYNWQTECSLYGVGLGAWALCLKNAASNIIQARITVCPKEISSVLGCLSDMSWTKDPGFSTSLKTQHRRATVAYSRINGTILKHAFTETAPTLDVPVPAPDLLESFDIALKSKNSESPFAVALAYLGVGNNTATLPIYAWWYFRGVYDLAKQDLAARRRAINGLQSLLAVALYHCQDKGFSELRELGYAGDTAAGQAILNTFPAATRDTEAPIYPAKLRYNLSIGRRTLIAYIVLGGTTLLLCFAALGLSAFSRTAANAQEPGFFPLVDFCTRCDVCHEDDGKVVTKKEFVDLGGLSEKDQICEAMKMRVMPINTKNASGASAVFSLQSQLSDSERRYSSPS
ncbi:hypothetical protein AJ79_00450 [Helicocarpus griseus UAMH5409]|uniref:Uncharacterized protein n=1 Tax=Helicocarpus griseus UAMH5409 TaxID=1447875 RepID=A0A2B7YBH9_9EURO|nr:hypothetical protein AJ79_00450 [Helicocarpus griseus UAMH5409]